MSTLAERDINSCVAMLKARGTPIDRRPTPELFEVLGLSLHLRAMTAVELSTLLRSPDASMDSDAAMFCLSVCDPKGNLQFGLTDIHEVSRTIDRRAITAVAVRAAKINRFQQ